ncbi:MAG: hypothetical protein P4N41_12930 [Negativicutes bacterium]|nr:hypothetical protein [Negativicutes bacterium]
MVLTLAMLFSLYAWADCPQSFISVPEEVVKAGYLMMAPPEKIGPTLRFLVKVPD